MPTPAAPMEIPDVPPGTPPVEIVASLGFDPASVQAVVVTANGVFGVSNAIPGGEPDPEPEPEP